MKDMKVDDLIHKCIQIHPSKYYGVYSRARETTKGKHLCSTHSYIFIQYALDLSIFRQWIQHLPSQLCIFTSRHQISRLLLETSEPRRMRSGFLRAFAVAGWQWMAHGMGVTGGSIGTPSMNAWRGPISNSDLGKVFVEYCWYSISIYKDNQIL